VALVEPHAGYAYSGQVAAEGFARVRGAAFERVLLLGPSHHFHFAELAVPRAGVYRTPLGDAVIDVDAVDRLAAAGAVRVEDRLFEPEHSLEAEIPFLQRCLRGSWRLLPVLVGSGTRGDRAARAADALRPLTGPATLIVASSDFTHYGPRFDYVPFTDEVPARIEDLDRGALEAVLGGDATGFEDYVERTGATICGRDAISVVLRLLECTPPGALAGYDTSGRMTGDFGHSVSYASVAFGEAEPPR
jgi:AmmeMemoRadiSam system protein B